jgi:Gpi18-like mannosyltransferase
VLSFSARSDLESKGNPAKRLRWVLVFGLILLGIGLRFSGLGFRSMDMKDYLLDWYNELATHGHVAFRDPFSNYTPPYIYMLYMMTKTAGFIPKVAAIKLISIGFDFLNAFLVYLLLKRRYPQGVTAWMGASAFLLLPTIWLNSAYWGQADAIYTCFLLLCLFFLMRDQPLLAMISLGVSFSFKAQAVFLGPLILLLLIRKKIPWHYLGIIPVVYALMMIPAALIGRPIPELLTIYGEQADTYQLLSMNAPNLYLFIPDAFYSPGVLMGLGITALVVLVWVVVYARTIREFTPPTLLLSALAAVALMPFFLPKMHDRYFYPADVLSFLAAFYFLGGWQLAMGYQIVSGMVYWVFLFSSTTRVESPQETGILYLAAVLNTLLLGLVFWKQWSWQTDMNRSTDLWKSPERLE